jgi:hypothetical protein
METKKSCHMPYGNWRTIRVVSGLIQSEFEDLRGKGRRCAL